jgi:acetyl esterase/lipase
MTVGWTRRQFLQASAVGTMTLAVGSCASGDGSRNVALRRDVIAYGPEPMQSGELFVAALTKPRPVVILLHGGYWRNEFERSEMAPVADHLGRAGYAAWNVDYRRVGDPGGGWPNTFTDVATAIDKLAELAPAHNLDLGRVVAIGHSAGAQLAMWAAARKTDRPGQPGGVAKVNVKAAVSLSGVLDLATAATATGTDSMTDELRSSVVGVLGGAPPDVPDRYGLMSPTSLVPLGVAQLLVHGAKDDRVPIDQSRGYVATATKAGDTTKLIELPNVDHFSVLDTGKLWWDEIIAWLRVNVGDPAS